MTIKVVLLNLVLFAATFLASSVAALVLGSSMLFRIPEDIRQEATWVAVRERGDNADELRIAREAIVNRELGFADYEVAAIDAQLAVIETSIPETEAFQRFCQTLAWTTCDKQRVRDALTILFPRGAR